MIKNFDSFDSVRNYLVCICITILSTVMTVIAITGYHYLPSIKSTSIAISTIVYWGINILVLYRLYKMDGRDDKLKYILISCFMLFYALLLFLTRDFSLWCYVVPLFCCIWVFLDIKLILCVVVPASTTLILFTLIKDDLIRVINFTSMLTHILICLILSLSFLTVSCFTLQKFYEVMKKSLKKLNTD